MKTYCKYHPLESARWYCTHCLGHLCRNCVPAGDTKKRSGKCPRCHQPLRYLGSSNEAQPFWTRIAAFFQYPLAKDPILLMLLCTILPLFFRGFIVSLVLTLLLAAIQTKYMYAAIEQTAEGNMQPPSFGTAFQGGGLILLIQQIAVLIGMFMLVGMAFKFTGPFLGIVVAALMVLVFPASVIVLAMENSAVEALNPLKLTGIISAIGWPYFVLYGYLVLLFLSLGVAQEFIVDHFPPLIGFPLLGLSSSYFMLVVFHMLGYLLFQFQYQLGFSADLAESEEPAAPLNDRQWQAQAFAEIDVQLKEGNYEQACEVMGQELRKHPQDLTTLDRLYRLLTAMGNWKRLRDMARSILNMLVTQSRAEEVVRLLKRLYSETDFECNDPLLSFHLAQSCHHLDEHKLVLRVLKDLHKEHPDFEFLPEAYLLVAKTLANGLNEQIKALSYLKFLQSKFPEHPIQQRLPDLLYSLQHKGLIT